MIIPGDGCLSTLDTVPVSVTSVWHHSQRALQSSPRLPPFAPALTVGATATPMSIALRIAVSSFASKKSLKF
jgi:hypothetical protein